MTGETSNERPDATQQMAEAEVTEEDLAHVTGGMGKLILAGGFVGMGGLMGAAVGSTVDAAGKGRNDRNAAIGAGIGAAVGSVGATISLRSVEEQLGAHSSTHGAVEEAIELVTSVTRR
jgi:hypothetical protein